jgi:hypothetical protein
VVVVGPAVLVPQLQIIIMEDLEDLVLLMFMHMVQQIQQLMLVVEVVEVVLQELPVAVDLVVVVLEMDPGLRHQLVMELQELEVVEEDQDKILVDQL